MSSSTGPKRRSAAATALDDSLQVVLEHLLDANEKITYRSIVRHINGLQAASSLTRDPYRRNLVEHYQMLQLQRREWVERERKTSQKNLLNNLADRDQRIRVLEEQVAILTASHKMLILAVGESGGLTAWRRFYDSYDRAKGVLDATMSPGEFDEAFNLNE